MTMEAATPMLRQYHEIKSRHKECILFFRLGDFYEMFYEDAQDASQLLELVLTSRGSDSKGRVPMCGIPYHSADNYIARLVRAGRKVALCEQVEDVAQAKGIVRREVVRVITAGTFLDDGADARFLMALAPKDNVWGVAFTDTATGAILTNQFVGDHSVLEVLSKVAANETIYPEEKESEIKRLLAHPMLRVKGVALTPYQGWSFDPARAHKVLCEHFGTHSLRGYGIEDLPAAQAAAGALVDYLRQMNKTPLKHLDHIEIYSDTAYVFLSPAALYGLELASLLKTMDHTLTPMGRRNFRFWLYHPLKDKTTIDNRLDAVALLKQDGALRAQLTGDLFKNVPDVEKSLSRISCACSQPKDFLVLRNVLVRAPRLVTLFADLAKQNALFSVHDQPELRTLLEAAIDPEMPLAKNEGKVIRRGFHAELDGLKDLEAGGLDWVTQYQAQEIRRTGINSLKVGFNKVFGYYIEVTSVNVKLVPSDYIRKQTIANGERYITSVLKEHEQQVLTAQDKILRLEAALLRQLGEAVLQAMGAVHRFCREIAVLDSLLSLAETADLSGYVRPQLLDGEVLVIEEGRHPVLDPLLKGEFIANDTFLGGNTSLALITGPNMSGKSTYIRQNALLVIMAQMGSFVPAKSARIGLVDKIFTRIGAQDDIGRGQSTFMVEMTEAADIINNLTPKSLIVLDEIGRGTSTYDGLALAWSLVEYLHNKGSRVFFATHFHELTLLAETLPRVKNYNVQVREWEDQVIFMHKIVPGAADDSYGLYVAKLAGMPARLITRARHILNDLESGGKLKDRLAGRKVLGEDLFVKPVMDSQLEGLRAAVCALDVENMTPLQALKTLNELKKHV